jgi:DNA-binding transcriptional MerR regulator
MEQRSKPQVVTVGQAAKLSGLSTKAVRLYEAKGLLPPAERTQAGYRLFTNDDLATLQFIRQAKALGLHLDEIKEILDLQHGGQQPCTHVISLLDQRIAEIDRTLTDLQNLRHALTTARATANDTRRRGSNAMICRIIETARP